MRNLKELTDEHYVALFTLLYLIFNYVVSCSYFTNKETNAKLLTLNS